MRLVGLVVAGVLIGTGAASAQYAPRPPAPVGVSAAEEATEIVQAMGLDPVGVPVRTGHFFVQTARDDFGRVLRVTVDARRSQVLAIEPMGTRAPYGGYAGYGAYRPYPGYAMRPYDDAYLTPPGSVMGSRMPPYAAAPTAPPYAAAPAAPLHGAPPHAAPPSAATPKPAMKSATAAPVPRKRPVAAPQESAGSVDPLPPQSAPSAKPTESVPTETAPPANQTPPVTPLE